MVVLFSTNALLFYSADISGKTYGESQTAIHYAAKNDAVDSLKLLIKLGSKIECRDAKNRTPLQVAAELGNILFFDTFNILR